MTREVQRISEEEVRAAVKKMKSGKAVAPDDKPVEMSGRGGQRTPNQIILVRGRLRNGEGVYFKSQTVHSCSNDRDEAESC